jgi:DNA-binding MarR family transcriptional regulator
MCNSTSYILHTFMANLDRVTDRMLKREYGISYRRAVFLLTLHDEGTMSQHELAVALGYSDPAVSSLLIELIKDKLVTSKQDPTHGRKLIVCLTSKGIALAEKLSIYLNASFDRLVHFAEIDESAYAEATDRLLKTLLNYEQRRLDSNNP